MFSTKGRAPWIDSTVEAELHAYLGGICKNLDCQPLEVGGYLDHVHVLCQLSRKLALMKLNEILKSHSSKWIKAKGKFYRSFYWQDGYSAFSVSPSAVEAVRHYIATQKEHHRKATYQDELRRFLQEYQIDYDERYLWD